MAEGEMAGWHHQLDGHESEQARGVGDGQGGLAFCSPWGRKAHQSPVLTGYLFLGKSFNVSISSLVNTLQRFWKMLYAWQVLSDTE